MAKRKKSFNRIIRTFLFGVLLFVSLITLFGILKTAIDKTGYATYISNTKQFSISYPKSWNVTSLKETDVRFSNGIHIEKNGAYFGASWGDGLGGGCPEELGAGSFSLANIVVQCHFIKDGLEHWHLIKSDNIENFSASAFAPIHAKKERKELLFIISNIKPLK